MHEAGTVWGTIVSRLLSSFQATLSEMSIIAQPETGGGRDVRLVSYVDPAKGAVASTRPMHLAFHLGDSFLNYHTCTPTLHVTCLSGFFGDLKLM